MSTLFSIYGKNLSELTEILPKFREEDFEFRLKPVQKKSNLRDRLCFRIYNLEISSPNYIQFFSKLKMSPQPLLSAPGFGIHSFGLCKMFAKLGFNLIETHTTNILNSVSKNQVLSEYNKFFMQNKLSVIFGTFVFRN